MPFQYDDVTANAALDAIETAIGVSPTLKIRSGAAPATPATADSGTVLATLALPADWLTNASSRAKALSGTWEDTSADNTGTAGHFRVYDSGGTCRIQGSVTGTGGGGDMTIDNTSIAGTQDVKVTSFSISD